MTAQETILDAMRARSAELAPEDHDDTAEACFREAAIWFSRNELASVITTLRQVREDLYFVANHGSSDLDREERYSLGQARTGVSRLLDTFDPQ